MRQATSLFMKSSHSGNLSTIFAKHIDTERDQASWSTRFRPRELGNIIWPLLLKSNKITGKTQEKNIRAPDRIKFVRASEISSYMKGAHYIYNIRQKYLLTIYKITIDLPGV